MTDATQPDSIQLQIPLWLPKEMVLPVATLPDGTRMAGTGFGWSRFLSHEDLSRAGVSIVWRDESGELVPRETALELIEAARIKHEEAQQHALAANDPS